MMPTYPSGFYKTKYNAKRCTKNVRKDDQKKKKIGIKKKLLLLNVIFYAVLYVSCFSFYAKFVIYLCLLPSPCAFFYYLQINISFTFINFKIFISAQ